MLARGEIRSSALARAQAQLSGKRVPVKPKNSTDELQEYINAVNKKTSVLKLSQPSVADLSEFSFEDVETEENKITDSPNIAAVTRSRFLKKKTESNEDKPGLTKDSNTTKKEITVELAPVKSKAPTSAALKKLATIEKKHKMRKLELNFTENDSDLRISDEIPLSARSYSDLSGRGAGFLNKISNANVLEHNKRETNDWKRPGSSRMVTMKSEDKEILQLAGSSVEKSESSERLWKLPRPPRTPSPPSKGTPRRNFRQSSSALGFISPRQPTSRYFSRTPSPPSHRARAPLHSARSLTRLGSRSPSPSVRSSLTNLSSSPMARLSRRSRTPLSQRSDLKSLDELFSKTEDVSSSSSNDFKLNILSLDDLAPTIDTQEEARKEMENKNMETFFGDPKNLKPIREQKSNQDQSASEIETETNEDSEISEHLLIDQPISYNICSLDTEHEKTVNSDYSEDFEDILTGRSGSNPSKSDRSFSISSKTSRTKKHSPHQSISSPYELPQTKTMVEKITKVQRKEMAVQTNDPTLTSYWPYANSVIGLPPTLAVLEPHSISRHVVSPEVIEALTNYSPMALALNDMLKQQLFLTQSFVDMARQLHLSTMKSLEANVYHYTTLEETKEYIKYQKALKMKPTIETNGQPPAGKTRT
ncbi:hypothetical protein GDO86_001188 [Hymenochirus boettgeri]|uniref:DUF4614 domain-containing protein n=1 Tax=Hymenochirus boettgeri TaxID=247094 RepID=A0A8T2KH75_9PIPI|nr:hypothetical protein GDO86_001188 [Hymenochirus boettgeri]